MSNHRIIQADSNEGARGRAGARGTSPLARAAQITAAGLTVAGASLGLAAVPAGAAAPSNQVAPASPDTVLTTGSYTGGDPQSPNTPAYDFTFYVSASGTSIENVSFPSITLQCAPGDTSIAPPVVIDSAAISPRGSFSTSQTQSGDYAGYPATFKVAFSGKASGTASDGQPTVSGKLTESVTYSNGVAYTCTSGSLKWSASRDASQTVTTGKPPVGSYTGGDPQSPNTPAYDFTFYVANSQQQLQNVAFPRLTMTCAPGGAQPTSPVVLDTVPLKAKKGSFATSQTWTGVYDGNPANYDVSFAGNFHGLDAAGAARAAGSITETMSYQSGGSSYSCTTNELAFSATEDASQTVATGPPPAGTYTGGDPQSPNTPAYNFSFAVSSSQTEIENVAFPTITMECTPGSGNIEVTTPISIGSLALNSDGSFGTTQTASGTVSGDPATFTTTFDGNFDGLNANGVSRAAGSLVDSVTYASDGTDYSCTTNPLPWSASA